MPAISPEIPAAMSAALADDLIREMIEAKKGLGLSEAIERVARRCRMKPRRIRAFWAKEIRDWWASEDRAIRAAHEAWMIEHRSKMDAQQALLDARLAALKDTA